MSNFRSADPQQARLLGYSIDDLVPAGHPVRRFVELVGTLDFTPLRVRYSGRGKPAFPPASMFCLFVWVLERFGPISLRRMQEFAATDMTCRFAADGHVPDHVTLSEFLTRCGDQFATLHAGLLKALFEQGLLTGRTLVLDGSKIPSAVAGRSSVIRPGIVFESLDKLAQRLQELYARMMAGEVDAGLVEELPDDKTDISRLTEKVHQALREVELLRSAARASTRHRPRESSSDGDQPHLWPSENINDEASELDRGQSASSSPSEETATCDTSYGRGIPPLRLQADRSGEGAFGEYQAWAVGSP